MNAKNNWSVAFFVFTVLPVQVFTVFTAELPEYRLTADVLRLQGGALKKLVAQAVVEGAVEARGAAVRVQHSEALHLVLAVDQ